jgi:hypothetical protein
VRDLRSNSKVKSKKAKVQYLKGMIFRSFSTMWQYHIAQAAMGDFLMVGVEKLG